jgi:predicted nucleic acid-binding protein
VVKIEVNEYIDFNELPPAKGKGQPLSQPMEREVVLMQAADLVQSRRLIPDFATWTQCFVLYSAVVLRKKLERLLELLAYQAIIAKTSQKYKWPS